MRETKKKLWSERNQMLLEPRSLSSGLRREFLLWTVLVDTRGEVKKEVMGRWEIRALTTVG